MYIICTLPCYATGLSGISEVVVYAVAGTLVAIMGDVGACASVACPLSSSCLVRRCGGGLLFSGRELGQGSGEVLVSMEKGYDGLYGAKR